ncbi:MAG: alpha/beta fold hydrolase [Acidimicrobiales bacterium]
MTTTAVERGRLPGDGVELAYAYWPGTGDPVVAIHGASSHALFYVGIADRLAGRRPLLALDLRGRGDADKPAGPYGLAQHADDVDAAMRAFGLDRALVVGHSLGSAVATVLAERHRERCAGVVLYDGGLDVFSTVARDEEAARAFLVSSQGIEGRLNRAFASRAEYFDYWRALPVFEDEQWSRWVEAYLDDDIGGTEPELRAKCSSEVVMADAQDLMSVALANDRPDIDAPVLSLYADHGITNDAPPLVTGAALEQMAARFRVFEAKGVRDVNHYTIALADPGASICADTLVAFAERCGT